MKCAICEQSVAPEDMAGHRRFCRHAPRRIDLDRLAISNEDAARLTRSQREFRVRELVKESHDLLNYAIREHIYKDGRRPTAVVGLYSGGNDSTTVMHLFRDRMTHAAHANTTIGIEKTRQFVRDTCSSWGIPLIERKPSREDDHYRALVLDQGFPGPGHHFKMFQRLKERGLRQIQRELVGNPRQERIVFIAGRRRQESKRRANIPEMERRGSVVYVSPLVNWTKVDMNAYRLMAGDVPVNEVSDLIHMSGECLCGSFAHKGEREEVSYWFPEIFAEIAELEALIADREDIPDHRKVWGWGAEKDRLKKAALEAQAGGISSAELLEELLPSRTGLMCSSCDDRFAAADGEGAA